MAPETTSAAKMRATKKRVRWLIRLAVPVLLLGAVWFWFSGSASTAVSPGTTFTVIRAPLEVTVLEGGSIEAANSQQLKSEVQGSTKILSIVEEGSLITAEDVANGKILVELDKKELEDRLVEQMLQYQNALATFTEAKEEYGIQVNQNESDVKAAELEVKFARLDMEKFLGAELAGQILNQVETETIFVSTVARPKTAPEASSENEKDTQGEAVAPEPNGDERMSPILVESTFISVPEIDFAKLADPGLLGDGEARQSLRKYENDLVLSEEEVGLANAQLEGTQRLFEKDFITRTELDNDSMKLKRSTISRESAETTKDIYIKYEFPKEAETRLSKYEEALRKMERARRAAVSKLAQAEAKLNSAQARYELQSRKLTELETQIVNCVIRATQPGLVIYGSGQPSWRDEDRIQEGTLVRERQVIITIPDTTTMKVGVKVHESHVKRVARGLKARVRVDAYPDRPLSGQVTQIAVLPDSENRWMNPDLKVYSTSVTIDGTHDWLKPGMSAETEIIIDRLENVVQVPIQAVQTDRGQQVCYVSTPGGIQPRPIKTGDFNDTMIQILEGLEPGEMVLLRAPRRSGEEGEEGEAGEDDSGIPAEETMAVAAESEAGTSA